jgi:hypothetical protein
MEDEPMRKKTNPPTTAAIILRSGLALMAAVTLASCGKSHFVTVEPKEKIPFRFSEKPNWDFQSSIDMGNKEKMDAYMKEAFTEGCQNPGQVDSALLNDPHLALGQEFIHRKTWYSEGDLNNSWTIREKVSELSADFVQTAATIADYSSDFTGKILACAADPCWHQSYKITSPTAFAHKNFEDPKWSDDFVTKTKMQTRAQCALYAMDRDTGSLWRVNYKMANAKVHAFNESHLRQGLIRCEITTIKEDGTNGLTKVEMGRGSDYSIVVRSNEVVSMSPQHCGGTVVFESHRLALVDKTVVYFNQDALLQAPTK